MQVKCATCRHFGLYTAHRGGPGWCKKEEYHSASHWGNVLRYCEKWGDKK